MKVFYTYLWLREDGTPYYVGKGTGKRANRTGSPPCDRIIIQEHESEEDALHAERFLISYYGRIDTGTGILRNFSDGGEGIPGYIPWNTGLTKYDAPGLMVLSIKSTIQMTGTKRPQGYKVSVKKGRPRPEFSAEWIRNISLGKTGKPSGRLGIKHTQETKQKIKRSRTPTHCKRGHEFSVDNSYTDPKRGRRQCKICNINRQRENRRLRANISRGNI